jgi:hypothetical protein
LAKPRKKTKPRSATIVEHIKQSVNAEPEYTHRIGEMLMLAPPEPLLHKCPDCTANEDEGVQNRKKLKIKGVPVKVHRLTYVRSFTETWGTCVTRHDVYRCRSCRTKWVSTNGRKPDVAASDI